jgi:hypothetical protein
METQYETIAKFDRMYGSLLGGNNLHTKPSTIKNVSNVTGESETFVVQVIRAEQKKKVIEGFEEKTLVTVGDFVVLEFIDKDGHKRIIIPPKVTETIQRGCSSLSARARRNASKAAMKERMAAGYVPKPPKRKKKATA